MWAALQKHLAQRREARALRRRAIPDALWLRVVSAYPFFARRSAADLAALRRLTSLFLSDKEFHGAQGLRITDEMAVAIAAQACLPVLRLGLDLYDSFVGIVVHPDEVVAAREVTDDDGVVHAYEETLTGEAMEGGPIMLAWSDVLHAGHTAEDAYNVVIHEFAHVLDLTDGEANGVPRLSDAAMRLRWSACIEAEYEHFVARVDDGDEGTVLDPYGAEGIEEFFAVAVEGFFVAPQAMRREHPALYAQFTGYFQQDPAAGSHGSPATVGA